MYTNREQLTSEFDEFGHSRDYNLGVTQELNRAAYGRPSMLLAADELFLQLAEQLEEQPNTDTIVAEVAAEVAASAFQNTAHIGPVEGSHNPIDIESEAQRFDRIASELWDVEAGASIITDESTAHDLAHTSEDLRQLVGASL